MKKKFVTFLFLINLIAWPVYGLEPNEILVIANSDIAESVKLAEYYCARRGVPADNILSLSLGMSLDDKISRSDYDQRLAKPIRNKLFDRNFAGKIRCLLTTYGVPIKVGPRGRLEGKEKELAQLRDLLSQGQGKIGELESKIAAGGKEAIEHKKAIELKLLRVQGAIDIILGKETGASVDSELSRVLFADYELYRWQPNKLKYKMPYWDFKSLMVSRLDGPGYHIAKGLVDKAIRAEKNGVKGVAYIDSGHSKLKKGEATFGKYDKSLLDLAELIRSETKIPVVEEQTAELFSPGQCPDTFIYCGWYSLKNYIDAFDFVEGAIGYHIASWEAIDLRDASSTQWCPAMLVDGVTATLGAVAEPYLHSFPEPKDLFSELFEGRCLVEAYYRSKPFNSWQFVLVGDPLYTPFASK